jgi:two-component system chemotaxis response regulator CheB
MRGHDLVVVGASAGGVEALGRLVRALEPELAAALLVVLHVPPSTTSALPSILARQGPLPVSHARDGETILRGHIYVAPPDSHLLVSESSLRLSQGPRENGHRPAIDPTFRSAARSHGPAHGRRRPVRGAGRRHRRPARDQGTGRHGDRAGP